VRDGRGPSVAVGLDAAVAQLSPVERALADNEMGWRSMLAGRPGCDADAQYVWK
jgi:hypothetical protein